MFIREKSHKNDRRGDILISMGVGLDTKVYRSQNMTSKDIVSRDF